MSLRSLGQFLLNAIGLGLLAAVLLYLVRPSLFQAPMPAKPLPEATGTVSYAKAVRRATPAVVSILTAQVQEPEPGDGEAARARPDIGLGSGVIVRPDGYVLTNNHVIAGADAIAVTLQDGRQIRAQVVGHDSATDLAVLHIPAENLPTIPFADSHPVQVGDVVMAIGNPYGIGQTVTMGIVSATGRTGLGYAVYEDFIQTDAAISYGNSGGALINAYGELVGISSAFFSSKGGENRGISFAIPTGQAVDVLEQILKNGRVIRGWLGISAEPLMLYPQYANKNHLVDTRGVIITEVENPGPAAEAGLLPGDILTQINGKPVTGQSDAMRYIAKAAPGSQVKVHVIRHGEGLDRLVTVAEKPEI